MILGDVLRKLDDPQVVAAALMQFTDPDLIAKAEKKGGGSWRDAWRIRFRFRQALLQRSE
ncbi:hypothetical protein [uncultured Rhodoblastus sp.]|uniref:hypothetical protein n=1 Tax=uncultured Rhodoblastus sp. TaxID=543037 RepID=UPI0025E39987|nr:hypothetical protein [uncultured Rhodoblastus sp.]